MAAEPSASNCGCGGQGYGSDAGEGSGARTATTRRELETRKKPREGAPEEGATMERTEGRREAFAFAFAFAPALVWFVWFSLCGISGFIWSFRCGFYELPKSTTYSRVLQSAVSVYCPKCGFRYGHDGRTRCVVDVEPGTTLIVS